MGNYPQGSIWRKWDLHVHTPASFLWKSGKRLPDMSVVEKGQSIKKFITTVNKSDVEVFAVMDYWTFDWFLELKKYCNSNPSELLKTVLPGMELRIECPVDYRLNIHVILSDKLSRQRDIKIWTKTPYSEIFLSRRIPLRHLTSWSS